MPANSAAIAVNRRKADRRSGQPFICLRFLGLGGRRATGRRAEDLRGPVYVDRYDSGLFFLTLAVLCMSALDAAFTLSLLSHGAVELNAVMATLVHDNVQRFVVIKLLLTGLALTFLVIHSHYRIGARMRVRHLHYLLAIGYATLIVYELKLLSVAAA